MKTFLRPLQNLAAMEAICRQAKNNRGILEIRKLRKSCMKIIVFMIRMYIITLQRICFFFRQIFMEIS